jgi:hypothetical protein
MVCSEMSTKIDRPSRSMKLKQDEVKIPFFQQLKRCVLGRSANIAC